MAFTIPDDVLGTISKLSNYPNRIERLKAAALKAQFDADAKTVMGALKSLIQELGLATAARNVGFEKTAAVNADNVQDAIENVQSQIAGVSQGGIADASITTKKIADEAVTSEKIKSGAIQKSHFTSGALQEDVPSDELTFAATSTACRLSTHWCKFAVALRAVFFGARFSNLSDADVERKRVYITASGTSGYAFTTFGSYSAYVTYKAAGTTKYVSAPVFTTQLASNERALCVVLPDNVTKDNAGISVYGLYFVS